MEYHNLLFNRHFGFRAKHTTIDALGEGELVKKIGLNCRNVKAINFFLDLKKAFDTIEHDILLKKLKGKHWYKGPSFKLYKILLKWETGAVYC